MDRNRVHQIHADPASATAAEIQVLAENAYAFARASLKKTLRDEFAMAALTALIAHYGNDAGYDLQADAYVVADDMLKARG